jgi:catechol 2,3-dioxygenase-like lactoylglutathione lyase family enzyme
MINVNVADLDRSVAFYEQLGFEEIQRMDVTDPSVAGTYGVPEFGRIRAAWMRLATARTHRWPVLDLVEFVDPPMLVETGGDARRRRGMSRLSFRVDGIADVEALHATAQRAGIDIVVPLTKRTDPGGRPLALFWMRDPDDVILEVLHVAKV